jgi:hypothetical protein
MRDAGGAMQEQPQKEHQWLKKLLGEWTYEGEAAMGPGQAPSKTTGIERVRPLGGLWVVAEGEGEMPGGGAAKTLITLGYDPRNKRYVSTWVGSMMTHLWVCDGSLDAAGKALTLNCEGPDFEAEGKRTTKYKDVIEFKSDDHRTLTATMLGGDGKWRHLMTTHYRRKK